MTNYQAALNSYSNALNTAMTSTVVNATNALWISITNLNAANIVINNLVLDSTRGNSNLYVIATNAQAVANIALTNYLATLNAYSNALNNAIITETTRATNSEAGLQTQLNNATNRLAGIEAQTSNWNTASVNATNAWVSRMNGLEGKTSTWNTAAVNATNAQAIANIALTNYLAQLNVYSNALALTTSNVNVTATNAQVIANIALTNYLATLNAYSNALNSADNAINTTATNAQMLANIALTNYVGPLNSATNVLQIEINPFLNPRRFKANIGNGNISLPSAGNPSLLNMTNTVLAATGGSIYSNTVAQWWPKATNGIVTLRGGFSCTVASNVRINLDIHKNGSLLTTVIDHDFSTGAGNQNDTYTWGYVDTVTPTTNDYYELFYTVGNTRTTVGSGTNNWWFGSVEQ